VGIIILSNLSMVFPVNNLWNHRFQTKPCWTLASPSSLSGAVPAHPRRAKSEPRMRPSQPESWRWCPMKKNPLLLRGLTQVLGILQIIKGNSYSTSSRKLRVVDLNPKTAISPFETTVVWEYNLPEIMYQGGWLLQVGSIISGYFVAWA